MLRVQICNSNRASVCAHATPKRKKNAMTCGYIRRRSYLRRKIRPTLRSYANGGKLCVRPARTRSILLKKKRRIIPVMRVAFTKRVNQLQAGVMLQFSADSSLPREITALDHEEVGDIDRRSAKSRNDDRRNNEDE